MSVRGGEPVAVLGAVLQGGQLGQLLEVLLAQPGGRQDGQQPLQVVGEHLEKVLGGGCETRLDHFGDGGTARGAPRRGRTWL